MRTNGHSFIADHRIVDKSERDVALLHLHN
jgi:hypothetical protein